MTLERFIQELIASTPKRRVEGKKRLQKLVYLLKNAGIDSGASFFLKDYGPFSREVENAADIMSIFGDLEETAETVGYNGYMATVYSLPDAAQLEPDLKMSEVLSELERFRSVELEVASTILYFEGEGQDRETAVDSTRDMKPSKTTDRVLIAADKILGFIASHNASSTHS